MTKVKKMKQKAVRKAKSSGQALANVQRSLDMAALAWKRLLADPCNAPLASPCYEGSGTGAYRRLRTIVYPAVDSVEGTYVFQLGTNAMWWGTHVAANQGTIYNFTNKGPIHTLNAFGAQTEVRALAGCVKVRYIGPESSRKGTIALVAAPSTFGEPDSGTWANHATAVSQVISRVGETDHEVKFVPTAASGLFLQPAVEGAFQWNTIHPTIAITYKGIEPNSLQFEVTSILEVDSLTNGDVFMNVPPASKNTLNQVMASLGATSSWAFSNIAVPVIRATASGIMRTLANGASATTRGMQLITL